jgi:nitrogen fixation NifU-like protein
LIVQIDEILDRYEQPTHRGMLPSPPARTGSATNPRCGDIVTMYAQVDAERLVRVTFDGGGCTISQAAADLTAELAEGQAVAAVRLLGIDDVLERLGKVVQTRIDCAALGLHGLQRALAAD